MSASGTVLRIYEYDAFGVEQNPNPLDPNPFRYCGEYTDKETNTIYLRSRSYNPATGRFSSEDPIRAAMYEMPNGQEAIDPPSLNLYTYCYNNPILFIDPSGLSAERDRDPIEQYLRDWAEFWDEVGEPLLEYWVGMLRESFGEIPSSDDIVADIFGLLTGAFFDDSVVIGPNGGFKGLKFPGLTKAVGRVSAVMSAAMLTLDIGNAWTTDDISSIEKRIGKTAIILTEFGASLFIGKLAESSVAASVATKNPAAIKATAIGAVVASIGLNYGAGKLADLAEEKMGIYR